jgi:hypothetical protein
VSRSALGYCSVKAEKDAPVLARLTALAAQYPRFGYRRIGILLDREGHAMSWGRCYRLWRRARLQVPRRRPRKRIATGRPRPQTPTGANQVWSYDFVFDWCANGQQLKCLTVTDEWTKEGLAIEVDGRIRSGRVIEVLSRLISERGAPLHLRSDNGPEFVARALLVEFPGERRRGQIAEARMRANLVVVAPPGLDHDLGLGARQEPFEAQALVAELAVEALADAVLPGLAGVDQRRLDTLIGHPLQQRPLPQRAGALRDMEGFAPRPVATPSLQGQSKSTETPALSS